MIAQTPKLKKSKIPYDYIGETVYVFHDCENGKVNVSFSSEWTNTFLVDRENIKLQTKQRTPIKSKPKVLTVEEKEDKNELNAFYDEMALITPFNCAECNQPLYAYNKFGKRSCTAHLLPKSLFPSIATNRYNIKFLGCDLLGVCDCHNRYDANLESRKKLKIYDEAVKIFATHLRYELNDEDLVSACTYLGINYKNYE